MKGEQYGSAGARAAVAFGLPPDTIDAWRDETGWEVVRALREEADASALSPAERVRLIDALVELELSSAEALVVPSLAHLGGTIAWLIVSAVAQRRGAQVLLTQGKAPGERSSLTLGVPEIYGLLDGFIRLERAVEVRAGQARASNAGRRISRHPPYGFSVEAVEGNLVENATELAAVARMRELRAQGASLRHIATQLTEEGFKTRRGGPWQRSTIGQVLKRHSTTPS